MLDLAGYQTRAILLFEFRRMRNECIVQFLVRTRMTNDRLAFITVRIHVHYRV